MTVHMFRCFIGAGPMSTPDLETRINDWVDSNATWENDTVPHELAERNTQLDGSGETYHAIDVRFLPNDMKPDLQQKFTDKLENKVDWYRVGYPPARTGPVTAVAARVVGRIAPSGQTRT